MKSRIFHSAAVRFTAIAASIFGCGILFLSGLVLYDVRETLDGQLHQRIEAESKQLLGDYYEDGLEELRHDIRERIEANPSGRLLYFIQSPTGKTIFDKINDIPAESGWIYHNDQDRYRLLFITLLDDGYRLGIAADRREVKESERAILHAASLALIVMLLFSLIAAMIISRIFMRYIDRMAQAAKEIGDGNLTRRLPVTGSRDELEQLAIIINQMLDRIQGLVENMQRVSANIAHDLRTPLSRVRHHLDQMKTRIDQQQEIHLDAAIMQLDQVMNIFTALLRIAEIESGTRKSAFKQINFSDIVSELVEVFIPVSEAEKQSITTSIDRDLYLIADKDLLVQLCVNLIENAIRYAGEKTTIHIALKAEGKQIVFQVADNGKGVPAKALQELEKPFYRLDESRTSAGSGLGLSLVKAIADLHGMSLSFADNKPGLRVELRSAQ